MEEKNGGVSSLTNYCIKEIQKITVRNYVQFQLNTHRKSIMAVRDIFNTTQTAAGLKIFKIFNS